MKSKYVLTIWLVVASLSISLAQLTPKVTDVGTGYLELLPPDYDTNPTKNYPLMLFLHGKGERGDGSPAGLEKVKRHGPPLEASRGHNMCFMVNGVEECFILIAPQLGSDRNGWGTNFINPVLEYVLNGAENYRVDLNRVYLTGLSLGGGGVYKYAPSSSNSPTRIAAISAIAGWGRTTDGCVISERKMAMWSFHGDQDRTVGYGSGIAMYNAVNNCTTPVPTAEVRFTTYEGVGHNSWSRAYRTDNSLHTPNLYEWLLTKTLSGNPTADAGPDQSIKLPVNSVVLNGSGSDAEGTITSYAWSKTSGPSATLANENTTTLTVTDMVEGIYVFTLTVTDNDGNTAADQVEVIVNPEVVNQPPVVNGGPNITLTLPTNSTNITAIASDADGSIASYLWTQRSGPSTANLTSTGSATVTANSLIEGTYRFRVTVTDDDGATAFDNIDVTINPAAANNAPTANAGPNINLNLPTNTTTLSGSGSDSDGSIASYLWEKVSGPSSTLANQNTPTLTASDLLEGVYTFRLTVTDNDGATGTDEAVVTVVNTNQNPTANAGNDITVVLPTNTTTLNGSGSDPDGTIATYSWMQISGPNTASIANSNNAVTGLSNLAQGVYQIELTVTDDDGASDTDIIVVTVNAAATNQPPVADAGSDISITLPTNSIIINGSATDPDGTIVSYFWEKVSGPLSLTLLNENTASVTASDLEAGTYVFKLTVTDDDGATDTNKVNVNVAPAAVNQVPIVDAGSDVSITLPNNTATLNGTASDADGTISSYLWTQVSGPSTATLAGQATASLTSSDLIAGTYTFELRVTDDDGATASDNVEVDVSAVNQPPVVSAGPDVNLVLPNNSINVLGTAIDPDGLIINSTWVQIGGPSASSTVSGNELILTNLIQATYVFQFVATDNGGITVTDDVSIFVTASNMVPIVDAGADQNLILPNNSTNLVGSATDADGSIASYSWSKVSGPAATLTNQNTPTVTVSNLVEGVYLFSLTAQDDDGDASSDEVVVTVSPAMTNADPVANAGGNITITLPTNSVNITGTGSDSDGSIATYQWIKTSGPAGTILNDDRPTMTASNLVEGTYIFTLRVTDDDGATDSDDMQLVVNPEIVNQTPTANAGPNIQLFLPTNSTNVIGSGSDPDGTISTYQWNLVNGPSTPTLSGTSSPTLSVSNLIEGVYNFELVVTDEDGASDTDNMTLTVSPAAANNIPIADAGSDIILTLPTSSANIIGSGSDTDGSITAYQWTKSSGPSASLFNSTSPTMSVSNLVEGIYTFRLTVTDDDGDVGTDEMTLQVLPEAVNQAPVVSAGDNQSINLPTNSTSIAGTASDNDGTVVSYLWVKTQGGNATLTDETTPTLLLQDLEEGNYTFRLTATDDDGATGSDEVNVTVVPENTNQPPVISAGASQTIFLPTTTGQLTSTSSDSDGTIVTNLWEKISGPSVDITTADQANTGLTNLQEGIYNFRITVSDDDGATSSDETMITVLPATVNQAPTAIAGSDMFLVQPESSISITGSGDDPDGTIQSYQWSFVQGPVTPTMTGDTTPNLTATNLSDVGSYTFRLTVTDDGGLTDTDDVQVFVSPDDNDSNIPPTADAGQDRQIVLPDNEVIFVAIAQDDGLIETYSWEQLMGPTEINIEGLDSDSLHLTGLVEGEYIFEVTVVDDLGAIARDQVSLSVVDMQIINPTEPSTMKVFSPNGDGQNDFWILGEDNSAFSDCELIIFNSQGAEVFKAQPYQNNWDGTFSGEELREGVYFYVLRCNGSSDNETTGSITLIR